jgi:Zn-dependent M16 (insulinase) family peptidase
MNTILEQPRFDEYDRIRDLISQMRARRVQSITGNGHQLAMMAASSKMSPSAYLGNRLRGLQGIRFVKALDDALVDEKAIRELADKFAAIHEKIKQAPREFLIIGEGQHNDAILHELEAQWQGSPASSDGFMGFSPESIRDNVQQCWLTSTQVNFCAKSYPTVPVEHPDAAALTVLGGVLRNGYLHTAIREQGGAYGGGASHDSDSAAFRFYSYRDPRLVDTLADFDASIDWLLNDKHEWRQVEEAILGVIGSIDKPASPAGEAKDTFHNSLFGRTPAQRQQFRQRVLEVTLADLQRVTQAYLQGKPHSIAVITQSSASDALADLGLEHIQL